MKKVELGDTVTTKTGQSFTVAGIVAAVHPISAEAVATMIGGAPPAIVSFVRDLEGYGDADVSAQSGSGSGSTPGQEDNVVWGT